MPSIAPTNTRPILCARGQAASDRRAPGLAPPAAPPWVFGPRFGRETSIVSSWFFIFPKAGRTAPGVRTDSIFWVPARKLAPGLASPVVRPLFGRRRGCSKVSPREQLHFPSIGRYRLRKEVCRLFCRESKTPLTYRASSLTDSPAKLRAHPPSVARPQHRHRCIAGDRPSWPHNECDAQKRRKERVAGPGPIEAPYSAQLGTCLTYRACFCDGELPKRFALSTLSYGNENLRN